MLAALTLANRLEEKTEALAEASGRLDALPITLRLAKRLGFLSNPGYESLTETARAARAGAGPPPRKGAVRYTIRSPHIERYLAAKLAHPTALVLIEAGAFCQAFFEDAQLLGRDLGIAVRDLAADSEPEKIFACALPKAKLESYVEALGRAGRGVHVE